MSHIHTRCSSTFKKFFTSSKSFENFQWKIFNGRRYHKKCQLKFQREWEASGQLAEQRGIQRPCRFIPLSLIVFNTRRRKRTFITSATLRKIKSRNFSLHLSDPSFLSLSKQSCCVVRKGYTSMETFQCFEWNFIRITFSFSAEVSRKGRISERTAQSGKSICREHATRT